MTSLKYLAEQYVHAEDELENQEEYMKSHDVIVGEGGIEFENEEGAKELEQLRYKRERAKDALVEYVVTHKEALL